MDTEKKREGKTDMQAMMDIYKMLGTPGASHKVLARVVGSWNTKIKSWMEPNKPPMESAGTWEQKMLLGGRFLQQEFTRDMMGSTLAGKGSHSDQHLVEALKWPCGRQALRRVRTSFCKGES